MKKIFLITLILFSLSKIYPQSTMLRKYICAIASSYQGSMGTGSGFIILDSDGNNMVITNHHVVENSDKIRAIFFTDDGRKKEFTGMRVIARDTDFDLAILSFAGDQRVFSQGLKLNLIQPKDGTYVSAAGFPSTHWSYSEGTLLKKTMLRSPDNLMAEFLMHSALIDHGSSGGPLLVEDANATCGFSVIGVNTLKSTFGGTGYSVPIPVLLKLLETAGAYFHDITEPEKSKEKAETAAREFGIPLYASIRSSGEENWYCFPVNTDGECELTIELEASENMTLEAYNEHGMFIESDAGKVINLSIKNSGNVYVKVSNPGRYWTAYRLNVSADVQ